jgi:hypothetical protein
MQRIIVLQHYLIEVIVIIIVIPREELLHPFLIYRCLHNALLKEDLLHLPVEGTKVAVAVVVDPVLNDNHQSSSKETAPTSKDTSSTAATTSRLTPLSTLSSESPNMSALSTSMGATSVRPSFTNPRS